MPWVAVLWAAMYRLYCLANEGFSSRFSALWKVRYMFSSCVRLCTLTCDNVNKWACITLCTTGCDCPGGQVIDTALNKLRIVSTRIMASAFIQVFSYFRRKMQASVCRAIAESYISIYSHAYYICMWNCNELIVCMYQYICIVTHISWSYRILLGWQW